MKWRDSRRFTLHVLRDFGMGKRSVENYVNRELQDFMVMTQVSEREGSFKSS
ncbi:Cytochrome P450 2C1 [Portunus trituberculatus]|uniref:Cytochrome P450 2C1 n=1 Tax=Portunus trituberculatus TaxID=210409 RepID=A0A5B7JMQ6_PORTR|nr:Cytochrome P450 2C1 [Portunus trituberculatus]